MTRTIVISTYEISGLRQPYYNSGAANMIYVNNISSNIRSRFPASSTAISKYLASSAFKRNNWNSTAWNNSGLIWNTALSAWTAKKSGAAGGVSNLSALTIDANKDWNAKGIYNLTYISAQHISSSILKMKYGWSNVSSQSRIQHNLGANPYAIGVIPSGDASFGVSISNVDSTYFTVNLSISGLHYVHWYAGGNLSYIEDGLYDIVEDLTPQLGGNLVGGSYGITAAFMSANNLNSKYYPSSLGHYFTNSGTQLRSAYKSASTGIFAIASHTHATSDVKWSGAYQFYSVSSLSKSISSNVRSRFPASSVALSKYYPSTTGKATSGSVAKLWLWSSNKSWYAQSSNVRYRFPASSTALSKYYPSTSGRDYAYKHSSNKSLHDTFTLNIGMVRLSANQAIKIGGFQMASSQNLYVWKACCVDSGGRSQGDLWIQVCSGSRGNLNAGPYTNIYKTSCNKIQKGNPLVTYGGGTKNGTNIVVRMMYSGTGVTPGGWIAGQNGRFGSGFCEMSTY